MVPQDKRVTSILRFGWKTPRALLFLLCSSLVMAPLPAQIRHVIHISVDGLRGDLLHGLLDAPGAQYPGFSRLRAEGAVTFNARCDFDFSSTTPNHIGMVTGLPVLAPASAPSWQQHGYQINISVPTHILQVNGVPPAYKFSVFDRVHDRGGRTMLLVSKSKLAILDRSYNENQCGSAGWNMGSSGSSSGGRSHALAACPVTRSHSTTVFSAEGAEVRAIPEAPSLTPGGAMGMIGLHPGENRN